MQRLTAELAESQAGIFPPRSHRVHSAVSRNRIGGHSRTQYPEPRICGWGLGTPDWGLAGQGRLRKQAEPRTQRQRSKRSLEKWDAYRPAGRDSTGSWPRENDPE
jgi:hypothetical protein